MRGEVQGEARALPLTCYKKMLNMFSSWKRTSGLDEYGHVAVGRILPMAPAGDWAENPFIHEKLVRLFHGFWQETTS